MTISNLNWKTATLITAFGSLILLGSCNDEAESGKTSTTTPYDTAGGTPVITDNNVPVTSGDTSNTTKRRARSGKVSIAMENTSKADKMEADKMGYYNYAETAPLYNAGQTGIETYINNSIQYPQDAIDNNAEGTVRVQFGIDENGKITNVKTLGDKMGFGLEEEAVRVISNMPKWTPGVVKGKKVKTWMVLPITYKIEG